MQQRSEAACLFQNSESEEEEEEEEEAEDSLQRRKMLERERESSGTLLHTAKAKKKMIRMEDRALPRLQAFFLKKGFFQDGSVKFKLLLNKKIF